MGAVSALSATRVRGANDRIRMGIIGIGDRGTQIAREAIACPNTDFVAFGHYPALLLGMQKCRHRRHIERALDTVFGEEVQDPRHPNPVAELAPGEAAN